MYDKDGRKIGKFQSTRPWGARHNSPQGRIGKELVSIHAPVGGATPLSRCRSKSVCSFNPRARGGRDPMQSRCGQQLTSFNPRARGGRDEETEAQRKQREVSIHAPVGGATSVQAR